MVQTATSGSDRYLGNLFRCLGELETVLCSITPPNLNSVADVISELVEDSVKNGYDIVFNETQPFPSTVSQGDVATQPRRIVTNGGYVVWVAVDKLGYLRVVSKNPFSLPSLPQ